MPFGVPGMPGTPLTQKLVGTVYRVVALALGAEAPDPDVMRRPPRARGDRLLSWGILARAYLFLGLLEALGDLAMLGQADPQEATGQRKGEHDHDDQGAGEVVALQVAVGELEFHRVAWDSGGRLSHGRSPGALFFGQPVNGSEGRG